MSRYFNVKNIIYAGQTAGHAQALNISETGSPVETSAEDEAFRTLIISTGKKVTADITFNDVGQHFSTEFENGTADTLSASIPSADGGAALTVSLSNALCISNGTNASHDAFGEETANFEAYSSDGTTSPLSIS